MSDLRHPRLRALGLATLPPLVAGLLLVGCSDSSTATAAAGGTAATTDSSLADTAAEDHDHDHGSDTTMADHDHADGPLDVEALHDLDDELAAGTLDPVAQRAVVADYITQVEELKPATGSAEAELLKLLQDLDAALAAGDVATAAPLATRAHDAAHELGEATA